jgi:hypothetical protein
VIYLLELKKYWKYVVVFAIIIGAFLGGRHLTPVKVKTVTQTITLKDTSTTSQNTQQESKTVIQYVDRPVDHIITKIVVKEPTGRVTETTTDATHEGNTSTTKTEDKKKDVEIQVKTEIVYKDKFVEKIVNNGTKDKYGVGLMVGYGLTGQGTTNYIPSVPKGAVLGAYGTYKLFDFAKAGIFVNSRGDAGLLAEINW